MDAILTFVLYFALLIHILLAAASIWKVWRGDNIIDRMIGAELTSTFALSVMVIIAIVTDRSIYIDVALGIAALGFISTIALSKYAADEQIF
jgi:multisubunit Na+/H+ antiporter MnhF subunit